MHVIMVEDETMVARRLARYVATVLGASLQRLDIFGDLPFGRSVPAGDGCRLCPSSSI